ncbi:hypothetical protein [Haloactinopolyspora alba]|uniref:hypothetical protein n=1 Tax=Haloactinopolyspora alba TaxID=648780 RepID=UPI001472C58F|nr:hypothetical protein [Haloactinopolyspora alba]
MSVSAAALAAAVAAPLPAGARDDGTGGEGTGNGYEVGVEVTISGDGAPGTGGTIEVSLPPVCWWEPIPSNVADPPVDATDPKSVYEWFKDILPHLSGHAASGRLAFPDTQVFKDAIKREKAGEDITWYQISSNSKDVKPCSPEVHDVPPQRGDEVAQIYAPFVAGEPPEPAVDPETLAIEARELMVIDEPDVERNPKIDGSGPVGATFVNIPTWFWVTDPEMVGGAEGTRTIRAEVLGTGVWAEVTAETGGLSVAYPGGSQQCPPEVALREWSPGSSDAAGCTVSFPRASVGFPDGYPVEASTQWNATWEGETGDGESVGGELDPLQRSTTVNVPVAEVQTLVQGAR